jgi:hypothetical protein
MRTFSMKTLIRVTCYFVGMYVFALPVYSQGGDCAGWQAQQIHCSDSNGCQNTIVVGAATEGELTGLYPTYDWCCNSQYLDYEQEDCIPFEGSIKGAVMEFAMTHTIWMEDCSGHFGPYSRSATGSSKPIDLRPKLKLK